MVVRHIDCLGARFVKAGVFNLQLNEEEVEFMFQRMMCRQDSLRIGIVSDTQVSGKDVAPAC